MGNNKFEFQGFVLALLLSLGSIGMAHASGFALIEMNASGQGNAYAGAAVGTNNASTIFFNPAGMMNLERDQLAIAAHLVMPSADFDNDGSVTAMQPPGGTVNPDAFLSGDDDDGGEDAFVPNIYWVKTINEKTKFGLGVNSPFGLTVDYDDEWVGRYHALLSELIAVNVNPSIAYRVNDKLSVGAGLSLMLVDANLSSAIDFGAFCYGVNPLGPANCDGVELTPSNLGNGDSDGKLELEADNYDDIATGFNLGLVYQISQQTKIGVAYRSEVDISVEGDGDFTVPINPTLQVLVGASGAFVDTDIDVDVTLPASFSASVAHQVNKITWLADITWTGWSSFDELRVVYENSAQSDTVYTEDWDDTMRYSVGFDYQYSDKLILRSGIALDETPVPSAERRTPRLPGNDRTWLSFGLTYTLNNTMTIDVGYSHLFVDDSKIDNTLEVESVPELNATLTGEYEAEVDILSAQLNWNID